MNIHKNARLTFNRRSEWVQDIVARGLGPCAPAAAHGISAPTARKWSGRFLAHGAAGLADRSSKPAFSRRAVVPGDALAILELRRKRLTQRCISGALGVSSSTVSRVQARAGISRLRDLEPAEPIARYEHEQPGDLLHIDTKKLCWIERTGHRVTGNRRDTVDGAGWECLFVAVDDHARIGFTDMYPDEKKQSAEQFLRYAVGYCKSLGMTVRPVLTDNGAPFRSEPYNRAYQELGIAHKYPRTYPPQKNSKAERLIQSALREWRTASSTRTRPNLPPGSTTTAGLDPTRASQEGPLCPDLPRQETTF